MGENDWRQMVERLRALEREVAELKEEKRGMREELWHLRDKWEEEVWARKRLEKKIEEQEVKKDETEEEVTKYVRSR